MTSEQLLIETVGGDASNAGDVLHVQPCEGTDAVDLIAAMIAHPEEDAAAAADIVAEAWADWTVGGWERGDDFRLLKVTRAGCRVFTVWGSAQIGRPQRSCDRCHEARGPLVETATGWECLRHRPTVGQEAARRHGGRS